jgi:hypothetical protein
VLDKTGIVIVKDPRAQLRDVGVAAREVPRVPTMTMGKMLPRSMTAGIMRMTVPRGAMTGFCCRWSGGHNHCRRTQNRRHEAERHDTKRPAKHT